MQNDSTQPIDIPKLNNDTENEAQEDDDDDDELSESDHKYQSLLELNSPIKRTVRKKKKKKELKKIPSRHKLPVKACRLENSACYVYSQEDDLASSIQQCQEAFNAKMNEPSVQTEKAVFNRSVSVDPFDRDTTKMRIENLLRLALRSTQKFQQLVPPPTPLSSSLPHYSNSPRSSFQVMSCADQHGRLKQSDAIWKELFDYFDFYNNRSKSMQELDERIEKKRSEIAQKIDIILKLDYSRIKQVMDLDIKQTMFSILDYSKLYENKIYIDQLCYLNLLIQDDLNNICYIESLYPSIRCLKSEQPLYADPKFDSTAKTLLLWHKIVKDLMLKSDQLGRFLGFAKRPEYLEHWNWFEQRLNYSRGEYEKVQEWLNVNLCQSVSSSTLINSPPISQGASPSIVLREPTYASLPPDHSGTNLFLRQISYLIRRPTELHTPENETLQSSLSFNWLSSRTSPDSIGLQQEHLFPVIIHHVDSFIRKSVSKKSPEPSPQSCEEVKFWLNETDEIESEEEDEEEMKSVIEADTDTKSTMKDNRKKLFREFLRKRLRKFGLTKTCDKIREVVLTSLSHALLALQIDKCEKSAIKQLTDYHLIPLHHKCRQMIQTFYHDEESVKFGVQSEAFTRLGLPSYRPLFIYLNNVILELMHLCVEMQNENKGAINQHLESKFSLLSIEVLTNECRECIEQAILVRQFYYHMIYSVFDLNEMDVQQQLEKDLYKFDDDLKRTISIYLDFITNWVQDLVRVSNFPKALWVLDNEWNFCKNNLYFVTATEDIYASRFCNMGIHVYESLIDMFNIIDNKYKEPLRIEIDSLFWDERYRSVGVDLSLSLSFSVPQLSPESDEDHCEDDEFLTRQTSCSSNEKLNLNFNEFKEEINKFRKFCLRTLDFTAEFLADLELAAKYELTHDLQTLLDKLHTTNHVLVNFTNQELLNDSFERSFLIFVPQEFAKDKIQIVRLLFIISEKDTYEAKEANVKAKSGPSETVRRLSSSNSIFDPFADDQRDSVLRKLSQFAQKIGPAVSAGSSPVSKEQSQKNTFIISPSHNTNGYLLYLKLNDPKEKWNWRGPKIDLHASRPVRLSLYHHLKPNALDSEKKILYLITSKQSVLMEKKINVKQKLQGSISLIKEKASFHPSIDESITDLKDKIYELRKICTNWIKTIETDLIPNLSSDPNNASLAKIERNVNEILRVSYIFGIELQNDIIKFMTQNRAKSFAQGLAEFSIQWCDYIVSKTDRGKGRTTRPWAANKGLHLVQVAVAHSVHLSSWEFSRLVQAIERCFSHLIGDNEHDSDCLLKPLARNISTSSRSLNFSPKITNKSLPPRNRFEEACQQFDQEIEKRRFKDRSIGKILEINRQDWIIAGTEVQFRWQLGLLIGEGSFGKVYSCVNLDTWEPMALKIIEFKNNTDIQNLQEIADEINNVVDINHENLVKVYGSELHRKEIFIFMEFCGDQCTLDRLSRDASGLPENLVRKYTKSLLKGVEYLHERNIIHRDVKGANIFLKSIDNRHPEKVVLKLGDFGCSIRLKDPIGTASRDQATGLRGTYAFMAPEVMASGGLKDEGYTYSADIWSVGCVVIEMFTGKRPWHPFKDEAILFKVHLSSDSEKKPSYPAPISEEANHFLNCCFEFEPDKRLLADQLLELSFAKVVDEDSVYD